jgi:hypothetical protein
MLAVAEQDAAIAAAQGLCSNSQQPEPTAGDHPTQWSAMQVLALQGSSLYKQKSEMDFQT